MDFRLCLGEQDADVQEQEWQQLEDLARSGEEPGSEAEELAFKNKVSTVTREGPPQSRMYLVPKPRFKLAVGGAGGQQGPAVGGQDGGVDVSMDTRLHMLLLYSHVISCKPKSCAPPREYIVFSWWHAGLRLAGNDVRV